jgi:hypothetical protein
MNLIIYSCCRESDRAVGEEPIRVEWSDTVPDIGETISLGSERHWFKVKITRYESTKQNIDVYLVHVNRTLSTPVKWDCEGCEHETIHIELSAVGEPILGFAFNVLGTAPQIGKQLITYARTDHPTLMKEAPNGWIIDRYDEFLPDPNAPYKAIYLAYCKMTSLIAA